MPQHQNCPPAKYSEDRNSKYHEERQKDVARILAANPQKPVEREHKEIDERDVFPCMRT
jgi:hypothetical protein